MNILRSVRDLLSASMKDPISLFGAALASVASALIGSVLALDLFGIHTNPYVGVLVFMILPGVFLFGLMLVPVGVLRERRRRAAGAEDSIFPIVNLNLERHRNRLLGFTVVTFVNLVILATVSYRGVEYMDSAQFCGKTCHSVMEPEFAAYGRSPHSRVPCVDCHTGPGVRWFVKSKLSGVGQVFALIFQSFERPIAVPVRNLRPARETCERCHWPEKVHGDRIKVKTKYEMDEASTELKTALILKVGGGSADSEIASGIHWHMNIASETTYVSSDETRQTIPYVRLRDRAGKVTEFLAPGATKPSEEDLRARGRRMDCVDCHNRPSHVFHLPDGEVDEAIRVGQIDRGLPFIKKSSVETLSRSYESSLRAEQAIPVILAEYYRTNYPVVAREQAASIAKTGKALASIYAVNVFPGMKVTWGTYPNHIGHMDSPGCFRCHDGEHASADGRVISNDCDTCHTLLAVDESDPEILKQLFPK